MKTCKHCPWFKAYDFDIEEQMANPTGGCYAEPQRQSRRADWTACHYYLDYFERRGLTDKPEAPDAS